MRLAWTAWVCLLAAPGGAAEDEKRPVPQYTNEDLARIGARRWETGVSSVPAVAAEAGAARPRASRGARDDEYRRREAFWRREAERERVRLEPMRERLAALERKLEHQRPERRTRLARGLDVLSSADPETERHARQIAALRVRIREQEARFEERARRAGALPGWLR